MMSYCYCYYVLDKLRRTSFSGVSSHSFRSQRPKRMCHWDLRYDASGVLRKIEYPFIPEYKSQQLNYRIFLNTLDFNEQNE